MISEDGLFGLKHLEGASQNKKHVWLFVRLVELNTV